MPDPEVAERPSHPATPLARKLGVKPEHRLLIVGAPPGWVVPDLPPGVRVRETGRMPRSGNSDVVLLFVHQGVELSALLPASEMIFPDGAVWVAWPRKAAGHVSDVAENDIRDAALPLGLVDVKVAALDQDWSGLRVVWRKERRATPI